MRLVPVDRPRARLKIKRVVVPWFGPDHTYMWEYSLWARGTVIRSGLTSSWDDALLLGLSDLTTRRVQWEVRP